MYIPENTSSIVERLENAAESRFNDMAKSTSELAEDLANATNEGYQVIISGKVLNKTSEKLAYVITELERLHNIAIETELLNEILYPEKGEE